MDTLKDYIKEVEDFQEEMNLIFKFGELNQKQFPYFFTSRKLVKLIDAHLSVPFLKVQDRNNRKVGWKKEEVFEKAGCADTVEINFEKFKSDIWPVIEKRCKKLTKNIVPINVWGQIISTIKGSADSHLFGNKYLPLDHYIYKDSNVFLTKENKETIYQLFLQYEAIKNEKKGFDYLDIVNHILYQLKLGNETVP